MQEAMEQGQGQPGMQDQGGQTGQGDNGAQQRARRDPLGRQPKHHGPEHGHEGARHAHFAGGRNTREGPGTARAGTSDDRWAAPEAVPDTNVGSA